MTAAPLRLLEESSATHYASVVEVNESWAIFDVSPPQVSGRPGPSYRLRIKAEGNEVFAREDAPKLLPAACPERHINWDGTFCLSWREVEPMPIVDQDTAATWWRALLVFLNRQQTARILRRWPGLSRAHGSGARAQQDAEDAARTLGSRFLEMLHDGRLSATRRRALHWEQIVLLVDRRRIVTVSETKRRVINRRSPCQCGLSHGRAKPIQSCGEHQKAFVKLAIALDAWKRAERDFCRSFSRGGTKCCGSMDKCQLAA